MAESMVSFSATGSVTFAGKDAVALYRAIALKAALNLAAKGMAVNRHMTRTKLLAAAGQLTGKRYKRGAYLTAAEDVQTWVDAMRSAIPVTLDEGEAP